MDDLTQTISNLVGILLGMVGVVGVGYVHLCAASRGIGYPAQSGGTRREFLGQPTHLEAKAEGEK